VVHLHDNGFSTESGPAATRDDLRTIRAQSGIPADAASCHTAHVGDYVVEGHVPADVIKDLLARRPPGVIGLAVPGMPHGSPGMETGRTDPYVVFAIKEDGSRIEFARR